jgi:hypothetical protein
MCIPGNTCGKNGDRACHRFPPSDEVVLVLVTSRRCGTKRLMPVRIARSSDLYSSSLIGPSFEGAVNNFAFFSFPSLYSSSSSSSILPPHPHPHIPRAHHPLTTASLPRSIRPLLTSNHLLHNSHNGQGRVQGGYVDFRTSSSSPPGP